MKNSLKYKRKFLIVMLISVISLFGLNNTQLKVRAVGSDTDTVNIPTVTTTVSTNMLDANSSVITEASVENMVGKNQEIAVTFKDLPISGEKIFAVLFDEVAGGIIDTKYIENNKVTFSNIKSFIKIPGIYLYKQNANDPDFLIKKENFIASTSYLMPYVRKFENSTGDTVVKNTPLNPRNANGEVYPYMAPATLYTTTVADIYSLAIPVNTLTLSKNAKGLGAKDILAAIIAEDENGKPIEVKQWVATDYKENDYLCRFEFLLPKYTKNLQIHLYKHGLYENDFICKYLVSFNKFIATDYTII